MKSCFRWLTARAAIALALPVAVAVMFASVLSGVGSATTHAATGLGKIKHIVVIYLENWSFDSLYGRFPGADGLAQARSAPPQDQP